MSKRNRIKRIRTGQIMKRKKMNKMRGKKMNKMRRKKIGKMMVKELINRARSKKRKVTKEM